MRRSGLSFFADPNVSETRPMPTEIKVPTLGESVTTATVGKWLKQPGETVREDEPVVELETDKVSVEVPAPAAGRLENHAVKEGDEVEVGAVLALLEAGAAGKTAAPAAQPAPAAAAPAPKAQAQASPPGADGLRCRGDWCGAGWLCLRYSCRTARL